VDVLQLPASPRTEKDIEEARQEQLVIEPGI
jgi:hypothetical protein